MMFGCAHSPMQFQLAPGTNQDDYERAVKECGGDTKQGGYFLFGPLIILAPAVAIIEGVKHNQRANIQNCMEAKGFKCIANCATKSLKKEEIAKKETAKETTGGEERSKAYAEKKGPTGFRDNNWGMYLLGFTNIVLVEDDGDTKFYTKTDDKLKIGEASLNSIKYGFWRDRFFTVDIEFSDTINFNNIHETLKQAYGNSIQINKYYGIEEYFWSFTDISLFLNYNEITDMGNINYIYKPIQNEIENADQEKANAGVNDL